MTPEKGDTQRTRLEAVFLAALERPTVERDEFLERECAAEPETLAAVREMLEGERLTRGASAWAGAAWEAAGLRFGPYRVTRRVGSGGMGVVYEAVRDDEFRKRVAIKTISPALLTEYAARKLREERQILAGLEHPNIARLLDGGTTADGLPYVVMEYIEGEPLTAFARSRRLGMEARLRLFLDVCAAVEFAHANLVVHADLKPANILVTAEGTPKLLDFGLARLMGGEATVVGALTPDYASPEQFSGGAITTASDVYSLGVVLCELLTGEAPARGARKRTGAGEELDNIAGVALESEPAQRYRSVAALGDDIRRYLNHYPVQARRSSWIYRARKYARRNRVAVAAASLLAVSVATGGVVNVRASRRTREQFEQTRALAHALLFDTYDAIAELPGATAARKRVAALANEYLDRLAAAPHADTDLRKELAVSYRRLAEIQGAPYRANLGDSRGALENYRKSAALLERCLEERPRDAAITLELARAYEGVGALLVREGDPYSAQPVQARTLALAKALAERDPRNPASVEGLAMAEVFLGQAFFIQGQRERNAAAVKEALRHYEAGLAAAERLAAGKPNDPARQDRVAWAESYVGYAHWILDDLGDGAGHRESALAAHERALEIATRALAAAPGNERAARILRSAKADAAESQWRVGNRKEALAAQAEIVGEDEEVSRSEPENREAQFAFAQDYDTYGKWLMQAEAPGWRAWQERAISLYAGLEAADPQNEEVAQRLIEARDRIGEWLSRRGDTQAAAAEYRAALAVAERLQAPTAPRMAAEQRDRLGRLRRK